MSGLTPQRATQMITVLMSAIQFYIGIRAGQWLRMVNETS